MKRPAPTSSLATRTLLAAFATLGGAQALHAASQTWDGSDTANWIDGANWVGNAAPGALSGTSSDIATFNSALVGGSRGGSSEPVVIDTGRRIGGFNFGISAGAYVIGSNAGNTLTLSTRNGAYAANSSIQVVAGATNSQVIAAPITFVQPSSTNGNYGFVNEATNSSVTLTLSGAMSLAGARPAIVILDGANTGNNSITGNISFTGSTQATPLMIKRGAGTWILSGTNTMTGTAATSTNANNGIQVLDGVLSLRNNSALGSAAQVWVGNKSTTYTNNGTGPVTSTYTSTTGGTLEVASGITLDNGLTLNLVNSGTLRSSGSNTINSIIKLDTAANTAATFSTVDSADVLTLGNAANDLTGGAADTVVRISGPGTVLLSQASNYAGTFSVNAGTLQLGNATALGSATTAAVAFGAASTGRLALNGQSATITSLRSNATPGTPIVENNNAAAATLTVSHTSGSTTYAGTIQDGAAGGSLALAKSGASTLVLSGTNTYTGGTTISGGTLTAGSASALGNGLVTIGSGGTLGASSLTVGSLVMTGSGAILLTDFNSQLTATGTADISGSGNLLTLGGSLAASGSTYTLLAAGTLTATGISLTGSAVAGQTIALGDSATVGRTNYAFNSVSNTLQLSVTGGAFNLTWNGGDGAWNTADANWQKDGLGSNIVYFTGDNITLATADTISVDAGGISAGTLAVTAASGTTTLNGGALGVLSVNKTGAGTLAVNNALTSSGALTVDTGTVALGSSASLTTGGAVLNGGTLDLGSTDATTTTLALSGGTLAGTTGVLTATASAYDLRSGDVSAILGGTVGLAKSTAGTVTLTGANTYSGATAISDGILAVSGTGTLGTGGNLTLSGGSLTLGGTSQTVGAVSVTAPAASGDTIGAGNLTGTSYAVSNTTGNAVIAANLLANAAAGLNKTGAGTATLSGVNTYTGTTNIRNGSLVLDGGDNRLLATASVVLGDTGTTGKLVLGGSSAINQTLASITTSGSGGSVVGGAATASTLTFNVPATLTVAAPLGGAATNENNLALAKNGVGTLTLSNPNTYSGGTSLNAGTLTLSSSTGAGTGTISAANGTTLNVGNASTFVTTPVAVSGTNANVNLSTANATGGFSNAFTGSADQSITISGATAVNFSGSTQQLSGFNGTVNIPGGTSLAFRASALNNGGANASFQVDGFLGTRNNGTVTLGSLSGSGTLTMGGNGTAGLNLNYVIGGKNTDTTFSGVIQDADATRLIVVTKTGSGSLTLSGANTYTGGTTINGGTLLLGAADRLADSGALTLSGGTFATGGFSETLAALTLTDATASFIDFGSGSSILLFNSVVGTGTLSVLGLTDTLDSFRVTSDPTAFLGQITVNGGLASAINQGAYWEITYGGEIPEPSSAAALAGLFGLGAAALRRRRRA